MPAYPNKAVHVHHRRVLTSDQNLTFRPLCLIACIKQKLIYVGEAEFRCDPGVRRTHAERVHAPDLRQNRQSNHGDGSEYRN